MRRVIKNLTKVAAISLAFTPCNALSGGIGDQMKGFWEKGGGYSNHSGPKALDLQSAGYYSMGGLYARTPVANAQIANISMPSINAGCGGINMFGGAFSFINSKELTDMLSKIANNAEGFAFQLALETISPVIAEKVEELNTWAQRINAMNINSCEAAATLVGGMWPRQDQASRTICSTLAGASGKASDYVEAKHGCQKGRKGTYDSISDASLKQLIAEDINIAWKSIKDSKILDGEKDLELAEMFMTLSGTIIIHAPAGQNDNPKFEYISSKAADNELISALLDGGNFRYHSCGADKEKCLQVNQNSGTHPIDRDAAFKAKIEDLLISIVTKIQVDEALNDTEKAFINNKTNIPLYKILNVYAAYSGAGALFELSSYSEAIALQLLFEYLDDVLSKLEMASNSLMIADEDHIKKFKDDLRETRKTLAQREIRIHQSYATLMGLVDRAMMIEGMLAKNIGSPLAESYQWSRKL